MTDENSDSKGWNIDPMRAFDLTMNVVNRLGLPLVLLGLLGWYLVPAHLKFLETATESQRTQTEIVRRLGDTATKVFNALSENDLSKLRNLDEIGHKLDEHGQVIVRVEKKVDEVKTVVEKKAPNGG